MFLVHTSDDISVNLDAWEGIKIGKYGDRIGILAFNDYVYGKQSRDILLAQYDSMEDAMKDYNGLKFAIVNGQHQYKWQHLKKSN